MVISRFRVAVPLIFVIGFILTCSCRSWPDMLDELPHHFANFSNMFGDGFIAEVTCPLSQSRHRCELKRTLIWLGNLHKQPEAGSSRASANRHCRMCSALRLKGSRDIQLNKETASQGLFNWIPSRSGNSFVQFTAICDMSTNHRSIALQTSASQLKLKHSQSRKQRIWLKWKISR